MQVLLSSQKRKCTTVKEVFLVFVRKNSYILSVYLIFTVDSLLIKFKPAGIIAVEWQLSAGVQSPKKSPEFGIQPWEMHREILSLGEAGHGETNRFLFLPVTNRWWGQHGRPRGLNPGYNLYRIHIFYVFSNLKPTSYYSLSCGQARVYTHICRQSQGLLSNLKTKNLKHLHNLWRLTRFTAEWLDLAVKLLTIWKLPLVLPEKLYCLYSFLVIRFMNLNWCECQLPFDV